MITQDLIGNIKGMVGTLQDTENKIEAVIDHCDLTEDESIHFRMALKGVRNAMLNLDNSYNHTDSTQK